MTWVAGVADVGRPPRFLERADDAHRLGGDGLLGLVGGRADVVRAVDVRKVHDGVGEIPLWARRLLVVHIERDAEVALLHRHRERVVVHDLATRGVDEEGARLHPVEHVGVHELARPIAQADVHAQHVAFFGHALRRLADLREGLDRVTGRGAEADEQRHVNREARPVHLHAHLAPDRQVHAEGLRAPRHLLADIPEAEQAERATVQAARLRVLLLVPLARAQIGDVVRDTAVEREDEAEGELGDRDRVLARAVRHVDAARRGGLHVDVVVAGAGAHDERQVPGVEHRLGDLRAAHDEHVGAGFANRLDERLFLQVRVIDDVEAEVLQAIEA